ncbi:class III chitinase protein [Rutstroemia sp. NJR-2017a WRK4]|nr:class III chitinase protein [Rutstroemia sp. NJR-2017a WRK4]
MYSTKSFLSLASVLAAVPSAFAGFSASSSDNVAIYWGQGPNQGTLASYCSNTDFNIIPVSFLVSIKDISVNVGNADPTQVGKDIITCQGMGKTILLSIGGETFTENLLSSSDVATSAAKTVWAAFGPKQSGSSTTRPFGDAVIDGFDFDIEKPNLSNMDVFAGELRSLMDAETSKKYYLTAAPQCPYPDLNEQSFLQGQVAFDAVFVQFYNNPSCGVSAFTKGSSTQSGFNMATWDNWAATKSKNKDVKVFVGIPGSTAAANPASFVDSATLADIITYSKTFKSFGGIMSWDMVTIVGNTGYLSAISKALGGAAPSGGSSPATSVVTTAPKASSTLVTSVKPSATRTATLTTSVITSVAVATKTATSAAATGTGSSTGSGKAVAMWSQCGGIGYTGSTVCEAGSTCVRTDDYWSACQ